jgi:hypothetical protein
MTFAKSKFIVATFNPKSNSIGAQYVTLQIKKRYEESQNMAIRLSKMVLGQHFCTVC